MKSAALVLLGVASASAIELTLIPGFGTDVQANPTHYGNPSGGCESDEKAIQVQGISGDFCSPACGTACPSDVPKGVTAQPQCALEDGATGAKYCALICNPGADDDGCGEGSCQPISGVGLCTYAAGKTEVAPVFTKQSKNGGFCDIIAADLPDICTCSEETGGLKIDCSVDFMGIDTIGVSATMLPCASPASMSMEITEADAGIDYPIAGITAGYSGDIPIPGLSVAIPVVGDAGVQAAVSIDGNADSFEFSLGLDACVDIPIVGSECGADLDPDQLPVPILSGSYSFGDLC